ncbi:MAG: DUF2147 domain-containing protein [Bradyrhizobium icense]|nr:MAG: DUF2147 domain-containing protein [Bradyrhizobium icense]
MKKLLAVAALVLASSAAHAQYTFDYGGKTIRIDPDRGTVQIPGVYDNTKKAKKKDDAPAAKSKETSTTTTAPAVEPQPATAVAAPPPAPPPPAPAPAAVAAPATPPIQAPVPPPLGAAADPQTTTAAATPSDSSAPVAPAPPPPPVQQSVAPPPPAARPAVASNSPIGVWLTEEKEGKVRIEQCGSNLCGYSVDKKTNQNGEQVLINMKPGKDKWSGRILDPSTGSTYDSTIAMKGTDTLRVQGCAFGGVFCGGQSWTRVN